MLNDKNIEKNVDFLTESMYNRCKIYITSHKYSPFLQAADTA